MVWVVVVRCGPPLKPSRDRFRGQAIPARGGKARRGGDEVHPTSRTEPSPHQAIPATDGGASRGGEARWRSDVPAST